VLSCKGKLGDHHSVFDGLGGESLGDAIVVDEQLLLLVLESQVEVGQTDHVLVYQLG
jgi:hypothetical protein